ncbi:hypothetical protein GCM10010168_64120 [Actinoplanes ianthinogenes]|uniref:Uncharacterized protein n=1 Tax=Actinoplanes ianthinogenes TaxID=122358 RepID=A0ABM7MA63_9ACTN|nr:hypothetical protein Aiant_91800 [Actinoplanes ianthinogenes]GGR36792.1 hypothetical protein GCM10010168_64120 [Actinoplanes ianthinogenes]
MKGGEALLAVHDKSNATRLLDVNERAEKELLRFRPLPARSAVLPVVVEGAQEVRDQRPNSTGFGSLISARAMVRQRCMPPERSCTRAVRLSVIRATSRRRSVRSWMTARFSPNAPDPLVAALYAESLGGDYDGVRAGAATDLGHRHFGVVMEPSTR